ncbi:MAG: TraM recognition domain-containing protein, partial [Actinomycetota bacterium]|nr:TraM recognition domain-containing protein [Actinomycetota bacterium]
RVGKSTSYVIPAIAAADGPVVATSNKRDIVDTTRLLREERGTVWVFDPQKVVGATPEWWWNPLRRVTTVQAATELAQIWIDTSKSANAVPDAYFETAGTQLLSGLIFAAALADKPASAIFWWLTDPQRAQEAVEVLHPSASHGAQDTIDGLERASLFEATAEAVASVLRQPEKQRGGVFGTAMKAVDWMQSPELRQWIEDPGGQRKEFLPAAHATSTDTLYSLSKEGSDVLRPLITALTADVLLSADEKATVMPGGRLKVPMLGALDECGNVCPWRQLPGLFSFFGSRGIPLLAVFQSPAQMRMTFGAEPAQALLSAANVRITMGGVEDRTHLDNLEKLFGTVRVKDVTRHRGGQGKGSSTTAWRDHQALTVDQLAAMRYNRAAVTLSACSPMLVRPTGWQTNRSIAPRIKQSISRYGANGMTEEARIVAEAESVVA